MATKTPVVIFLLTSLFFSLSADAQRLKLRSYSVGYRLFEVDAVGNNPLTIAPLLKKPAVYQAFINTINNTSLHGNPGAQVLHTFYASSEWIKHSSTSRFWKKYSIQTGLLLTGRIKRSAGSIGDLGHVFSPDTFYFENKYALTKKLQFLGALSGINRRFKLSEKLSFMTGLHLQGSVAFTHRIEQTLDSGIYKNAVWIKNVTRLKDLKGRNFFEWQAIIPLGLELDVYRKQIFVRIELNAGKIDSKYRSNPFRTNATANGVGFWIIYNPNH